MHDLATHSLTIIYSRKGYVRPLGTPAPLIARTLANSVESIDLENQPWSRPFLDSSHSFRRAAAL